MTDLRVNICGTGAMACLFGARLSRIARVTVIGTWPDGLKAIREDGIRLEGASADPFRVTAVRLGEETEPAELVLILAKTWQNPRIAEHLARLLVPGGIALTFQNGLGNREILGPAVLAGTTSAGATLIGPGRVRPGGDGPTYAAAPAWIVSLLRRAGFAAHRCGNGDIDRMLWGKLTASCGINAITALLGICNGELVGLPDAERLMASAAAECAAVAQAKGIVLPFSDPVKHARTVARQTAANCSSMLQDLLRGAPTEVDAINGAVVREGIGAGIAAPVNETLWRLVRAVAARPRGRSL
jgi:2-dehydropantoate 2-reductase